MIRANIDVLDDLVISVNDNLRYNRIKRNAETRAIQRLWLFFGNAKIGCLLRVKVQVHLLANPVLNRSLLMILQRACHVQTSKIDTKKCTEFLLIEICVITIHKS